MYKLPQTLSEDISRLAALAGDYQAKRIEAVQFKAFRVPMGIYEQRKNEIYMARIRATGGVIFPLQLLEIIEIARRHKSDLLHITTRQEIQIQNLELNEVEPVLQEIRQIGLSTKGGGGNTVRNLIVSGDSGISKDEVFDTTPYAIALTTKLIAEADSYLLPRKLKIAFSSDDKRIGYAAFNDLGLVARLRDGKRGFRVYVGGGGGSHPAVGWLFSDFIPEEELFVVAEAVKKFFSEHGNRKNKHKARLRYIFYKLGKDETLRLIREYYEQARATTPLMSVSETVADSSDERPHFSYKASQSASDAGFEIWKKRYVKPQKQEGYVSVFVPVLLGNIRIDNEQTVSGWKRLLLFINQFGNHTVRFTNEQSVRLRNIPEVALDELYDILKTVFPEVSEPVLTNNIIACTGADTCRLGIGLSKGLATAIRRELLRSNLDLDRLADVRIHISGCPNSCGQQFIADIGFSGKILRNDRIYPGYQVYLGARRDESPRLSEPVGNISARDIPEFVRKLFAAYTESFPAKQFALWLEAEGKTEAIRLLDEYKQVPLFEEDKNYYYDWGADTVFSIVDRGAAECSAGLFDMIDVDQNVILENRKALETATDTTGINHLLHETVFSSARMLLVTRGAEPKTSDDVYNLFISHFIDFGFVEERFRNLVIKARDNRNADFSSQREEIYALADAVVELYKNMDDSLQFKNVQSKTIHSDSVRSVDTGASANKFKDLRGVACPMNFVQTKILLAPMSSGQTLEIWLDDGQPIENVPGSVRGEGHEILEQTQTENYWKLVIKKK
ncbi:MAG: sulfurtransferase TusA family protein [Tannerella sp.]|jgi:sulfite reductase (ferredoxin)|nr:sulfurtransferase TusA family protein [Tannerella sp.]